MPGTNRSIGGRGQEIGGPNMGNDYSRDITREVQREQSSPIVIANNKRKKKQEPATDTNKRKPQGGPYK